MHAASRRGRQARLPSTLLALVITAVACPHLAAQASPGDSVRVLEYTTAEGTWISLDVSPVDGTLVFELVGDVYTLDAGGGQARPLLTGPAFQSQPRWSPDGARIAFISDGTGSDNVWVATADGSDAHALSTLPRSLVLSPAWSADGRAVFATVVDAYGARTAALWRWDVATGEGAPLVENANGPPQPLVSSPAPGPYGAHAAPDGEWLWYTAVTPRPYGSRNGASTRILRRHLGSGREEPVALEGISPMKPVLSRDGRWLVYGAVQDGRTGLRLRDLQRARERWLAYPVDRNALESRASRDVLPDLAFTPDGAAVMAAYGGRIHRLPVDGSASEVVPFQAQVRVETRPAPDVRVRLPDGPVRARRVDQVAVGPDGRLVFSALGRIWVAGRAGERPERLTRSERPREFMPAVSPDGRQVAFVTWGAEGGHLWVTRRDGRGEPRAVGGGPALWVDPAWTPDGRALVALRAPVGSARAAPELVPPDAEVVWVAVDNGAGAEPSSPARPDAIRSEPGRPRVTDGASALDGTEHGGGG
ncbi:MAG: PD40 domain-containing protein, partial [Gemmatimonadetes bacterium]|nr:PD40 domain-containing protein [Gemmatimonadota bacterium]